MKPLQIKSRQICERPLTELFVNLPILADAEMGGITEIILKKMSAIKAIVKTNLFQTNDNNVRYEVGTGFYFDTANLVTLGNISSTDVPYANAPNGTLAEIFSYLSSLIVTEALGLGYTGFTQDDIQFLFGGAEGVNRTEAALSLSLQTSTGAVGTQVSTTHDALVTINGTAQITSNIAGAASADIIVEVAPTNSATAGDWVERGRIGTSQTYTLAIALQGVGIQKSQVVAFVPKGYYIKARSVGTGTFTNTLGTVRKMVL